MSQPCVHNANSSQYNNSDCVLVVVRTIDIYVAVPLAEHHQHRNLLEEAICEWHCIERPCMSPVHYHSRLPQVAPLDPHHTVALFEKKRLMRMAKDSLTDLCSQKNQRTKGSNPPAQKMKSK